MPPMPYSTIVQITKLSTGSAAASTSTASATAVAASLVDSAPNSIVLVDLLTQGLVNVAVLSPSRAIYRTSLDFTERLAILTTLRLTETGNAWVGRPGLGPEKDDGSAAV